MTGSGEKVDRLRSICVEALVPYVIVVGIKEHDDRLPKVGELIDHSVHRVSVT
jgi:hypothetical protein